MNKRLCKAEAGGGRCHDKTCKCVHIASFLPTGMSTPLPASLACALARPFTGRSTRGHQLTSARRLLPALPTQPRR